MNDFVSTLEKRANDSLKSIRAEETQMLVQAKKAMRIFESLFDELKAFVRKYEFENEEKEIQFFKEIKPRLFWQLIYYQKIYKLELDRPTGGKEVQIEYLKRELEHIRYYFNKNKEFYHYYRDGADYLDSQYFLRGRVSLKYMGESFYFERDPDFSTYCDFKMAKIIANENVEEYLRTELQKLLKADDCRSAIFWTGNKNELVLLAYGLHKSKRMNHGKLTLKESMEQIQLMFNIDLGNYSRTYNELQNKKNGTTFLEYMKNILDEDMQDRLN